MRWFNTQRTTEAELPTVNKLIIISPHNPPEQVVPHIATYPYSKPQN